MHAGDALTLGRLAVTPLFMWSFAAGVRDPSWGWLPASIFTFAAASDVLDGRVARRAGRSSARGAWLDAGADIGFLLCALGSGWWIGIVPWWVPASIAASFAYYVADSLRAAASTAAGGAPSVVFSRIGHWGGICNFVLVGVLTFEEACGLHVLGPRVLAALFLLVPIYSAAAIVSRLARLAPRA